MIQSSDIIFKERPLRLLKGNMVKTKFLHILTRTDQILKIVASIIIFDSMNFIELANKSKS
jgi:hypothetical protein